MKHTDVGQREGRVEAVLPSVTARPRRGALLLRKDHRHLVRCTGCVMQRGDGIWSARQNASSTSAIAEPPSGPVLRARRELACGCRITIETLQSHIRTRRRSLPRCWPHAATIRRGILGDGSLSTYQPRPPKETHRNFVRPAPVNACMITLTNRRELVLIYLRVPTWVRPHAVLLQRGH